MRPVRSAGVALAVGATLGPFAACGAEQATPTTEPATTQATTSSEPTTREGVTHEFVIPEGTAARLERGEYVDAIPRSLEVRVGDRISVRNDDSELARLGIFDVWPGETISMAFNTPGQLEGIIFSDDSGGCGVPPPDVETFVIDVRA